MISVQHFFFSGHKKVLAEKMQGFRIKKTAHEMKRERKIMSENVVGEGGFEPPKLKSNRFTVCPLWPLGNSPLTYSDILPAKPIKMELVDGLEPPTC